MREAILQRFPAHTHALTLVSDPDNLLTEERIATELADRGFTIIFEPDPVLLRLRVEQARPWTTDRPLMVVTAGELRMLPYDLWQQGHYVVLSLPEFFPNLAYPVVRTLSPDQLARLADAPEPHEVLGRQATLVYVLRHVFGADLDELRQPAGLIAWLNDVHARAEPVPSEVARYLLTALRREPAYADWPLEELLNSAEAFRTFVREQWRGYVQEQTGRLVSEEPVSYILEFRDDRGLQDHLAQLVRTGAIEPIGVAEPERLPSWARAGVLSEGEDRRRRRVVELRDDLTRRLEAADKALWSEWQVIAREWAELSVLTCAITHSEERSGDDGLAPLRDQLDRVFERWLRAHYAPLGGQSVPPHHVYHVPHFLAYERRRYGRDRVALIVLDGMSLADWHLIGSAWRARHRSWRFTEQLVLAQIPTITAISRQALVSGRRPSDFMTTTAITAGESRMWTAFWEQAEMPTSACAYVALALDREEAPALPLGMARALCLVDHSIDEITHGASLGAVDVIQSLGVWLERVSPRLEKLIDQLLSFGFTVYVASDHGHVEARGIGQPSEGLAVETRGRRARVYRDKGLALSVQSEYDGAEIWDQDGVLPDDVWVVLAPGRTAFAPAGDTVVTHGGTTIEEVVVPFVTIALAL